jgi:hypothetical protein
MEQTPEGTPKPLSEYLIRHLNDLILSVNSLKDTIRLWKKDGFSGTFIGNLTGNVSGNLTGNVSGNSFAFPATQVSSSNANTLDDYEEGTWNPVVTASSGAITAYTSTGSYTKIGNLVSFHFSATITNKGTATGSLHVGLPFTCGSTSLGVGRESTTGKMCQVIVASTYCAILDYANATIIANHTITGSITYQATT